MDPKLLEILCCPESKTGLRMADDAIIGELNQKIVAGSLKNRAGEVIREELDGGLIREDNAVLYPIRQEIPVLLMDESILLGD